MLPARFFIRVTRAVALLKRAKVFIVSVTYMCVYLDTYDIHIRLLTEVIFSVAL